MAKRKINPTDQPATSQAPEVTLVTTAAPGADSSEHPAAAPSLTDGEMPIPELSVHAQITQAIAQAQADADHAKHGLLAAIENAVLDLRTRIATLDHDLSPDVQAIVDRIKSIL